MEAVYCPDELGGMTPAQLDYMTEYIEAVPWVQQPITPEELRAMAMTRKKPTSCGLDGVTLRIFQALPILAWQMITTILDKVETGDALAREPHTGIAKAESPAVVPPLRYYGQA